MTQRQSLSGDVLGNHFHILQTVIALNTSAKHFSQRLRCVLRNLSSKLKLKLKLQTTV